MPYTLGQNVIYRKYQRRKIGKRLHTHKCYEPNKAVSTVVMNSGNGGVTADGELIQGGGDIALVVEHRMTQQLRWKQNEEEMDRTFKRLFGVIARTSTQSPPNQDNTKT